MILAAALLWLAAPQTATVPLSPVAFRDRFAAAMGRPTTIVDDRTFRTTGADGQSLTVSIDNAYAQYRSHPETLDDVVQRFVRVLLTPVDLGSVEQLVVIVRPTNFISRSLPPGASADNILPSRPMAGDLSFFLAIDSPDTIRAAGPGDLKRLGLTEADAWRRATANIKMRMGDLQTTQLGSEHGASGFGAASGLAPSLLADPSFCGPAAPDGVAGQVVLVYARDLFLYAVPSDRAQTTTFWRTVKQETDADRSMSRTPLTCRGGQWVVAAPL